MTPDLINKLRLTGIRIRQLSAAVTNSHNVKIYFLTARHGGCSKLSGSGSGDNGFKFRAHYSSLIPGKP